MNDKVLKVCKVDGCDKGVCSRGYCKSHYEKYLRWGESLTPPLKKEKICIVPGCNNKHIAKGYCEKHYRQIKKHGKIMDEIYENNKNKKCKVKDCEEKHHCQGYCRKHYERLKRFGDANHKTVHDLNDIVIHDDHAEIILCNRFNEPHSRTLIDLDDIDKVKDIRWCYNGNGEVHNREVGSLHRFIMNAPDDMVVDHINHNRLDNRKQNLRICTARENSFNKKIGINNTSGYKGIIKINGRYRVTISCDNIHYNLGTFNTIEEALKAYKEKELELFGEYGYYASIDIYNKNFNNK